MLLLQCYDECTSCVELSLSLCPPSALSAYQHCAILNPDVSTDTSFLYGVGLIYFSFGKYSWLVSVQCTDQTLPIFPLHTGVHTSKLIQYIYKLIMYLAMLYIYLYTTCTCIHASFINEAVNMHACACT